MLADVLCPHWLQVVAAVIAGQKQASAHLSARAFDSSHKAMVSHRSEHRFASDLLAFVGDLQKLSASEKSGLKSCSVNSALGSLQLTFVWSGVQFFPVSASVVSKRLLWPNKQRNG